MASLVRERPILKPAQLNALARDLLEGSFAQVWVQGEVSNYSRPASGHLYFTLKDERAQVRCALFRQKAGYLRFTPRDGQQVLVRGRLTLYEARGDYQLVLEHMEEAGEGALRLAFEALKQRLSTEGLFDAARKRPLPRFVRRLGILTSASGAAVRDVLSVIARRFPMLEVEVIPVPVQGEGAAAQISERLVQAGASGRYDALLLTRGGGSLEDLWAFNDEALARAIAACPVPVVSAVGHEIDISLADLAADLRAATPSAAAELLAPDSLVLSAELSKLQARLDVALRRRHEALVQRCDQAAMRLQARHPLLRMERSGHRLAQLRHRLDRAMATPLDAAARRLRLATSELGRQHPSSKLALQRQRSVLLELRLNATLPQRLSVEGQRLQALGRALHSLSPFATLARGYAIVRDPASGAVLRQAARALPGQALEVLLAEGLLDVTVRQGS